MTDSISKLNETYLEVEVRLEFYQASREQRLHAHPLLIESLSVFCYIVFFVIASCGHSSLKDDQPCASVVSRVISALYMPDIIPIKLQLLDVEFIVDGACLSGSLGDVGLFRSANILQIADVVRRVVLLFSGYIFSR